MAARITSGLGGWMELRLLPYALTYCTYHKKDNNIISLMSGSGCSTASLNEDATAPRALLSQLLSVSFPFFVFFYALLLCFWHRCDVEGGERKSLVGVATGSCSCCVWTIDSALSLGAVKPCVSSVLCLHCVPVWRPPSF